MGPHDAAWRLKNSLDGDHAASIDALRSVAPFVRILYAPPVHGQWEILAIEPAEPPSTMTLYRRAAPEHQHGLFWAISPLEAWLHTAGRVGLITYQRDFEHAELVGEFVMLDRHGRTSGGEFVAIAR